MAVEQLKLLKVAAQIDKGDIPKNKADVQGLLCGVAEFDWNSSRSTIRPGAICENLTSFSGSVRPPRLPQTTAVGVYAQRRRRKFRHGGRALCHSE